MHLLMTMDISTTVASMLSKRPMKKRVERRYVAARYLLIPTLLTLVFLNTSKKIEEFFGIMRSLSGGNPNFDSLELRNRAGDAATCDWIYGEHPEWKEQSRRLKSCIDRKNVRSWKGDTKVANVNEVACWNNGRDQALAILRSAQLFSENELDINHIMETEPGVDMFRPYCRTIGVLAGDRAEYTFADLDEEADDEEVEA